MKLLVLLAALMLSVSASAQDVTVTKEPLGSGQPNSVGTENAVKWENNIYHAPQYMPGYPTAGVIYPRVVDVQCTKTENKLNCKGYNWLPEMGRGEYLMFRPVIVQDTLPVPIPVTSTVIKDTPVVIEVAKKKIAN